MNVFDLTSKWAVKNNVPLSAHPQLRSTNDLAKTEAFRVHHDTLLYLAGHQTDGRGRFERVWVDNGQGEYLLSSWSFKVSQSPSPVITARVGLSVVEALSHVFPEMKWSLKAPNDIYLNERKVAGILTEAVTQGDHYRLIIGLGINVLSSPKVDDAGSLKDLGKEVTEEEWESFLTILKNELLKLIPSAHERELQPTEQTRILHWLNLNPNLKESYSSVGADGSLSFNGKTTSWENI